MILGSEELERGGSSRIRRSKKWWRERDCCLSSCLIGRREVYVCWNFKLAGICVIDVIIHSEFITFFSPP